MPIDRQKCFDIVAEGLILQNRKSQKFDQDGEPHCAYRGEDGTKCGIGFLIPDEFYDYRMDECSSVGVADLISDFECGPLLDDWSPRDKQFLGELQNIHDGNTVDEWPCYFEQFALDHDLDDSVVRLAIAKRDAKLQET